MQTHVIQELNTLHDLTGGEGTRILLPSFFCLTPRAVLPWLIMYG